MFGISWECEGAWQQLTIRMGNFFRLFIILTVCVCVRKCKCNQAEIPNLDYYQLRPTSTTAAVDYKHATNFQVGSSARFW